MTTDTSANPFTPPSSQLWDLPAQQEAYSIEQALTRGYDFAIGDLIGEAWQKTRGLKGIVWGGAVIYMLSVQTLTFILGLWVESVLGIPYSLDPLASPDQTAASVPTVMLAQFIVGLIASVAGYPFMAGLNMIGIRQAAGQPVSFNEMFGHLAQFKALLMTGVLMTLMIYAGFLLLVIPGLYLSIAYILAIPLVAERKLTPWQALEASRKAISQHWFKVFGLFFALGVLMMLSMIPLGIGLIWTLPLMISAIGILYRTIFGVLPPPN